MDDTTELDLTELSDPALLDLRHDLHTRLAIDPKHVVPEEEYERIEREVARRVSGTVWRDARP